ncbi:MAG TPA: hypothetical protein VM452_12585 [Caulifigura sp.]|jgi:hypothetical protein|nr:hypothetical protein [Caulifigura sp.]
MHPPPPPPLKLLDVRMKDGSRNFADVPERLLPSQMRKHIARLPGVVIQSFAASVGEIEAWIEFRFRGYDFSMNNQNREYWLFVKQPDCPDEILREVATHCDTGA